MNAPGGGNILTFIVSGMLMQLFNVEIYLLYIIFYIRTLEKICMFLLLVNDFNIHLFFNYY